MRSYEAARRYFNFQEAMSWGAIIAGVIVIFIGLSTAGQVSRGFGSGLSIAVYISAVGPGLAIIYAAFFGLVGCQLGRAGVDCAEYAQQTLKVARDQLEVSRQALAAQSRTPGVSTYLDQVKQPANTPGPNARVTAKASYGSAPTELETLQVGETIEFRGHEVKRLEGGFLIEATVYPTVEKARVRINALAAPEPEALPLDSAPVILGKKLAYRGYEAHLIEGYWTLDGEKFRSREHLVDFIDRAVEKQANTDTAGTDK